MKHNCNRSEASKLNILLGKVNGDDRKYNCDGVTVLKYLVV